MKRPWRVHVKDIGPNYSFATEDAARERARALIGEPFVLGDRLVGGYGEVVVYETGDDTHPVYGDAYRRWIYRHDIDRVREEVFVKDGPQWTWRWEESDRG